METQRIEAGRKVESAKSVVQEVGGKCGGRGAGEIGEVDEKSDVGETSDFICPARRGRDAALSLSKGRHGAYGGVRTVVSCPFPVIIKLYGGFHRTIGAITSPSKARGRQ